MLNIPQLYLGNTRSINPVQRIQRASQSAFTEEYPILTLKDALVSGHCVSLRETMQPLNQVES
jgi:hypothetical protein